MSRENCKRSLEKVTYLAGKALMVLGIIYLSQLGDLTPQQAHADDPQDVKVVNHIEPVVFWSPQSDRYAYFCSVWSKPKQLCIVDTQGNIFTSPTDMPVSTTEAPSWSPDGEHIVFSCRNDQDQVEYYKWMNCMADKKMGNLKPMRVYLHPELVPTPTEIPVPTATKGSQQ